MNLHNDILESIGNTPMVKVNNIDTGKCDLLLKLENLNLNRNRQELLLRIVLLLQSILKLLRFFYLN